MERTTRRNLLSGAAPALHLRLDMLIIPSLSRGGASNTCAYFPRYEIRTCKNAFAIITLSDMYTPDRRFVSGFNIKFPWQIVKPTWKAANAEPIHTGQSYRRRFIVNPPGYPICGLARFDTMLFWGVREETSLSYHAVDCVW